MFPPPVNAPCWVGLVGAAQRQELQPVLQGPMPEKSPNPRASSVSVALDDLAALARHRSVVVSREQWQDKGFWQRGRWTVCSFRGRDRRLICLA